MILFSRRAAVIAALFLCGATTALRAQDITLTSGDGLITLHGTLESYDGEFFRVNTTYGLLTLDAQGVGCKGPGCPDLTSFVADITIAGARSVGEVLLPALIEGYATARGLGIRREIQNDAAFRYVLTEPATGLEFARIAFVLANSDQGLADLQAGTADLALSLRRLGGLGDDPQVVGHDALVPLVAKANALRAITLPELAALLAGQTRTWQAFGGVDAPVVLHALDAGNGLQQVLEERLLAPLGLGLSPGVVRHATAAGLADAVAADPFAVGVGAVSDMGNAAALALRGDCGMAQAADGAAIKTGDYPLTAPLYLYRPAHRLPLPIRELLDWIASPQADRTLGQTGFLGPTPDRIGLNAQGDRLAGAIAAAGPGTGLAELQRMAAALAGTARLTTTFRFEDGARTLDAASRTQLQGLAGALEAGEYDGQTLVIVGFSDGLGEADDNLRLSQQRAEAVRAALLGNAPLLDADRVTILADGFGEALPMACDDTDWGTRTNRRVEVWVRRD